MYTPSSEPLAQCWFKLGQCQNQCTVLQSKYQQFNNVESALWDNLDKDQHIYNS